MTHRYWATVVYRDRWGDPHVELFRTFKPSFTEAKRFLINTVNRVRRKHRAEIIEAEIKRSCLDGWWIAEWTGGWRRPVGNEFFVRGARLVCPGAVVPGAEIDLANPPAPQRPKLRFGLIEDARHA